MESNVTRIDKYLWATRVYKTRSVATEECRKGRVLMGDEPVKPSRVIKPGDIIVVRKPPVVYTYRVLSAIQSRVGAALVKESLEDLTPEAEKSKLSVKVNPPFGFRQRGTGRPTKRERRIIDRFREDPD